MPNPVEHFELSTRNMDAAAEFYGTLFGWQFNKLEGYNFALINTGSKPGGGLSLMDCEEDFAQGLTVTVDDIENYLNRAAELGGEIAIPKKDLGNNFGFYGAFRDPSGLVIGLWSDK